MADGEFEQSCSQIILILQSVHKKCLGGGIGRHAGLKILCVQHWAFGSKFVLCRVKYLVSCLGGGIGRHAGLKVDNLSASEETQRV